MCDEAVSKECLRDPMVVSPPCLPKRELLHDIVIDLRLNKVKEKVTDKQPSAKEVS